MVVGVVLGCGGGWMFDRLCSLGEKRERERNEEEEEERALTDERENKIKY